ncbi:hypothetical protein C1645_871897 [Glomus cerebriforme]|uniref:Uncharacterized protein n=1 Tax=Glomus cerebriforme TaxID=658196 RepID=A0A397TEG7_9GLOM|nr:hypothetical protein C1645_871897 [Glomus cerebriforme]
MGTHSITVIRERSAKRKEQSILGGPAGSQYFYEYYACIYQHFDGYVEGGVGEWLANFLCNFTSNLAEKDFHIDTGLLGTRLIHAFSMSNFKNPRFIPIASLEELFKTSDYTYAYLITVDSESLGNQSVMLSVYVDDFILTARPEKFLAKYKYYSEQMEKTKKSFAEINYGDDEVKKEGYFSEDLLLLGFLTKIRYLAYQNLFCHTS